MIRILPVEFVLFLRAKSLVITLYWAITAGLVDLIYLILSQISGKLCIAVFALLFSNITQ